MLIQGKLLSFNDDLSEAYYIRKKVFVEEQGMDEAIEFDHMDQLAMHVIVYEEDSYWCVNKKKKAVATGRIIFDGIECSIDKIAVLKENRNHKYGDFTVRMLLNKAFTAEINEVFVITDENNMKFFEIIGFIKLEKVFTKNNLNYIKMKINSNDLTSKCKNCQ